MDEEVAAAFAVDLDVVGVAAVLQGDAVLGGRRDVARLRAVGQIQIDVARGVADGETVEEVERADVPEAAAVGVQHAVDDRLGRHDVPRARGDVDVGADEDVVGGGLEGGAFLDQETGDIPGAAREVELASRLDRGVLDLRRVTAHKIPAQHGAAVDDDVVEHGVAPGVDGAAVDVQRRADGAARNGAARGVDGRVGADVRGAQVPALEGQRTAGGGESADRTAALDLHAAAREQRLPVEDDAVVDRDGDARGDAFHTGDGRAVDGHGADFGVGAGSDVDFDRAALIGRGAGRVTARRDRQQTAGSDGRIGRGGGAGDDDVAALPDRPHLRRVEDRAGEEQQRGAGVDLGQAGDGGVVDREVDPVRLDRNIGLVALWRDVDGEVRALFGDTARDPRAGAHDQLAARPDQRAGNVAAADVIGPVVADPRQTAVFDGDVAQGAGTHDVGAAATADYHVLGEVALLVGVLRADLEIAAVTDRDAVQPAAVLRVDLARAGHVRAGDIAAGAAGDHLTADLRQIGHAAAAVHIDVAPTHGDDVPRGVAAHVDGVALGDAVDQAARDHRVGVQTGGVVGDLGARDHEVVDRRVGDGELAALEQVDVAGVDRAAARRDRHVGQRSAARNGQETAGKHDVAGGDRRPDVHRTHAGVDELRLRRVVDAAAVERRAGNKRAVGKDRHSAARDREILDERGMIGDSVHDDVAAGDPDVLRRAPADAQVAARNVDVLDERPQIAVDERVVVMFDHLAAADREAGDIRAVLDVVIFVGVGDHDVRARGVAAAEEDAPRRDRGFVDERGGAVVVPLRRRIVNVERAARDRRAGDRRPLRHRQSAVLDIGILD